MQYAMIIEKGERNYSAYFPDLPGCIATGKTVAEIRQRMRETLELHLRGLREDGLLDFAQKNRRPHAEGVK